MPEIIISNDDELEFDLSSIGLNGWVLVLDENSTYFMSEGDFIQIPQRDRIHDIVKIQSENTILLTDDTSTISVDKNQFLEIQTILDKYI